MIFHMSIEAENPEHVAQVIAEMWDGKAFPFPGVTPGSWMALAGDEFNTGIEVYPRRTKLYEGAGPAVGRQEGEPGHSATHVAISSVLSVEQLLALAEREGWKAKVSRPGNAFDFVEMWVEGHFCLEAFAPEQQQEYLENLTIPAYEAALERWKEMAAAGKISRDA